MTRKAGETMKTQHPKLAVLSALLAGAALLAACASSDSSKGRQAARGAGSPQGSVSAAYSEAEKKALAQEVRDEITVGRMMAARIVGQFGYYEDPGAQYYVNLIGQSLAAQSGRPELKYYFAVLDTAEVNAMAAPGGYIFVTRGLLAQLKNESELAAVLGHEIAHINEKHMYERIKPKQKQVTAGETLARLLSRGGSDIGQSISQMVTEGMNILLEQGLGKEKEYEADEAGTLYAAQLGYNAHGLPIYLERLARDSRTVQVSKTHPPFAERIHTLRSALNKNGIPDRLAADERTLADRFARNTSTVSGGLGKKNL